MCPRSLEPFYIVSYYSTVLLLGHEPFYIVSYYSTVLLLGHIVGLYVQEVLTHFIYQLPFFDSSKSKLDPDTKD